MKEKRSDSSRRSFLQRCLAGVVMAGASASPALALNRMNKAASRYQNHPNGDERCGGCRHFQPPGSCEIVPGHISPRGWCKWYKAGHGEMGSGY